MKNRILYFGLGALALTAASCSSDDFESLSTSAKQNGLITATVEGNKTTRAGFDNNSGSPVFYWTASDTIGVTLVSGTSDANNQTESTAYTPLTLQSGAGTATATFNGPITDGSSIGKFAIYPYYTDGAESPKTHKIETASGGTTLTYYFRPDYYYNNGLDADFYETSTEATAETKGARQSYYAPLFGKVTTDSESGSSSVAFSHLSGVICVQIPNIPAAEGVFTLTTDKSINGEFTATIDGTNTPELAAKSDDSSAEAATKTVTVHYKGATEGQAGVFYVPVPTGTFTTVTATLADAATDATKTYATKTLSNVEVTRTMLYGVRLAEAEVSASGNAASASSVTDAESALQKDDASVTLTAEVSGTQTITVPAVTATADSETKTSKSLVIESVASGAQITIEDDKTKTSGSSSSSDTGKASVDEMTVALPSVESGSVTINMENTTVSLESTTGSTTIATATVSTADDTFIVGEGVTITTLNVAKGNVRIKKGGKVGTINGTDSHTVYVDVEDGGTLTTIGNYAKDLSEVADYKSLKFALTANHAVSTKLTADIELTAPITISGDGAITLDLAGKTIKPASSYSAVRLLNVLSGGSLTINDSSTDAKGAIISNGVEAINHVIDWTNAKVVINGGNYSDLIPLKVLGNNAKVNVTLAKDQVISSPINIGNSATNNVIKATVTIDFNSKKVSASKDIFTTANPGKFNIRGASDVTFKGPGKIEARTDDAYAVNVYNGTLSIEGDLDVEGNVTVIRVQTGQLNIAGGTYKLRQLHSTLGRRYMLNCIDANYANGSAKIEVTGGTFYGFDPANSDSENPKASFVKTGYKSTQSTNTVQDEFHTSEQIYTYTVSAESE